MAVTSGFFNSQNHDRVYNAEDFGSLFDGVVSDGIFLTIYDRFETEYLGNGGGTTVDSVRVKTGKAWFNRTWITNDEPLTLNLSARSSGGLYRKDAVAIKIDKSLAHRENSIVIVKGNTASTAAATTCPMPVEEDVYYYPAYYVVLPPSGSTEAATLIDNRGDPALCPYSGGSEAILPIEKGGTGAGTASAARANLGAAAASHMHNASAINAGTLDVARIPNLNANKVTEGYFGLDKGGTGATTAAAARTNLEVYGKGETYTRTEIEELVADIQAGGITPDKLTGIVPITKGGTGYNNADDARNALGAAAASHTHAASAITSGYLSMDRINTGAIATAKLADSAVTTAKINAKAVTAAKIADSTITATQLASGAITEAKIGAGAVTEAKIANNAVTRAKLSAKITLTSGTDYGSSLPSTGTVGQIFFKAV